MNKNIKKNKYNFIIVGLGSIGMEYGYNKYEFLNYCSTLSKIKSINLNNNTSEMKIQHFCSKFSSAYDAFIITKSHDLYPGATWETGLILSVIPAPVGRPHPVT